MMDAIMDTRCYDGTYECFDYTLSENWDGSWEGIVILDGESGEETIVDATSCFSAEKAVKVVIDKYIVDNDI